MTFESWINQFREFFVIFFDCAFCFQLICGSLDAVLSTGHLHLKKKILIQKGVSFLILFFSRLLLTAFCSSFRQYLGNTVPYLIVGSRIVVGLIYLLAFERSGFTHTLIKTRLYLSSVYVVSEIGHQVNLLTTSRTSDGLKRFLRCLPHFLMVGAGFVVGKNDIDRYSEVPASSLALSATTFLALYLITFRTSRLATNSLVYSFLSITILVIQLAFFLTEIGIYIVAYRNREKSEKILFLQAKAKLNEASYIRLKLNEESIARTSVARHDRKNHYAYIKNLLEEGKYSEALSYVSVVNEDSLGNFHIIDCGNRVISSIRNLELSKSRINNIPLKYLLAVPSSVPFKETDLCSLITNLVDNAFENYSSASQDEAVEVKRCVSGGYFRIIVTNPSYKKELNLKTKKKTAGHGYGIRIIQSIARSYNGHVNFELNDGRFCADIRLDRDLGGDKHADNC